MLSKKLRLYPTSKQELQFKRFCGTARFAYNECLAYKIEMYNNYGITTSVQDCIKHIQELKSQPNFLWIAETPEAVTKQAIRDLDKAYKKFLRQRKAFQTLKRKVNVRSHFISVLMDLSRLTRLMLR